MKEVYSGYQGGKTQNPTYGDVCSGSTGHAEVVEVEYDPAVISYEKLLEVWLGLHDPTMDARHYRGGQYRSVVFYTTSEQEDAARRILEREQKTQRRPIVSEISPAPTFWKAEEYHQKYYEKHRIKTCSR